MIIGVTQRVFYHNNQAYDSTDQAWYRFFNNHTVMPIANRVDLDPDRMAKVLDVLVLTGGNDPSIRRITETRLVTAMMKQHKPIIGICHGAFLLTELMDGVVSEIDDHYNTTHDIYIDGVAHSVNSHHSLRIEQAPADAQVIATDADGNCEAWQYRDTMWAIVWHPERMAEPFLPNEVKTLLV